MRSILFRHASKDHLLELVTPSRTYYIQADTSLDMKEWIEAFQSVILRARSTKVSIVHLLHFNVMYIIVNACLY